MDRTKTVVTPERYASGMTFEQYLAALRTIQEHEGEIIAAWRKHFGR